MKKNKILILIPFVFTILFIIFSIIAFKSGEDKIVSTGFLFGVLTMPTSIIFNQLIDIIMNHKVPIVIQYTFMGLAGLFNILIIEGLYLLFKRKDNRKRN
jgi:thiamine transporter ThiT